MTPSFVRGLVKMLNCPKCKALAAANRKFCRTHLAYARTKWHAHVARCAADGRCINCRRKKLAGEQRCTRCKNENRAACKSWWQANRERLNARYRTRVLAGLCGSCGLRPAVKGHVACTTCHGSYRS
jgi:hypothetical protein